MFILVILRLAHAENITGWKWKHSCVPYGGVISSFHQQVRYINLVKHLSIISTCFDIAQRLSVQQTVS